MIQRHPRNKFCGIVCVSSSDMIVVFFFVFFWGGFCLSCVCSLHCVCGLRPGVALFFFSVWGRCWFIILSLRCLRSCVVVVVFAIVAIVFGSSSLPNRRCFSYFFKVIVWVFFFFSAFVGARVRVRACVFTCLCVCVCFLRRVVWFVCGFVRFDILLSFSDVRVHSSHRLL